MNYLNDFGNQYQPKKKTWKDIKEVFKKIEAWGDYKEIVKALVSYEKGIDDEETLEKIYENYMDCDCSGLFCDEMNYIIEETE